MARVPGEAKSVTWRCFLVPARKHRPIADDRDKKQSRLSGVKDRRSRLARPVCALKSDTERNTLAAQKRTCTDVMELQVRALSGHEPAVLKGRYSQHPHQRRNITGPNRTGRDQPDLKSLSNQCRT